MFDKILVPVDGTETSAHILKHLAPLLRREGAEVQLFAVVVPIPERGARADREQRQVDLRLEDARRHLLELASGLETSGVHVRHDVALGDPADRILREVERFEPSLVAMATHGRRGIARWVRGSVAERVLRRCPVPLLLARIDADAPEGPAAYERILVPLDGSERSASIVPLAESVARTFDSELILMRVGHLPSGHYGVPAMSSVPTIPEIEAALDPLRGRLQGAGIRARTLVTLGDPASEILEVVERQEIGLVAMSTHGYTGLDRWLFGSVAENVLRHCRAPLLVQRTVVLNEEAG